MSKSGFRADRPFWSVPQVLVAAFGAVVMAYAFQGLLPVFNNDDVRQVQAPETMAMITQGRWLYYVLFNKLLDQNPVPGFSTFLGSACLVGAAWLHARLIGLRHPTAVLVLTTVSSISIYYGYMFDFDSTRIAYPLGNLLSAAGLVLVGRSGIRARLGGVALLGLSPAFYPATVMYQVTLLIAAALFWCVREGCSSTLRRAARCLAAIGAGIVVYRILTTVIYAIVGFELDDRGSLNPFGLRDNWAAIETIISGNSLPFLAPSDTAPYFAPAHSFGVLVIFVLFLAGVVLRRPALNRVQIGFVLVGFTALLFSPFFLIAITETDYYPVRSLYSFAAVYGALLAITFECGADVADDGAPAPRARLAALPAHWMPTAVLAVAVGFVLVNASLIGQKSYDQSLAWQSDVAHINRIIYRIDEVLADEPSGSAIGAASERIPIVVVGDLPWRTGPRGQAVRAWLHPWSRENIFALLDSRFVSASAQQRERAVEIGGDRDAWPSRESVFVDDGVVVVVR